MTSAIKPPGSGGKPPIDPKADVAKSDEATSAEFRGALETSDTSGTTATAPPTGVEGIIADLQAGRIDASTAIDRIVADAMNGPDAATLDAVGREELERHLRTALAEDPNIAGLARDLGSG